MKVEPGKRYVHHKGACYLVLALATNSTDAHVLAGEQVKDTMWRDFHLRAAEPMVVYLSSRLTHHVRALAEFIENVEWPDGKQRPRFIEERLACRMCYAPLPFLQDETPLPLHEAMLRREGWRQTHGYYNDEHWYCPTCAVKL